MSNLDKDSPIPLYIQFKEYLLDRIERGELEPGQWLPSEREFCDQFGVSRITIRQALNELMRDGLIQSVPGKGMSVAQKQEGRFRPMASFSQYIRARGQSPSSRVLEQTVIRASRGLARELQIQTHAEVVLIERLCLADGEPCVLQTAYLPSELCPNILKQDFAEESLHQTLRGEYGLVPVGADNSFEARLAELGEEELLRLPHPSAVLVMRQTSYLRDGRPLQYTRLIYRANERFHSIHGPITSGEEDL